MSSRQVDRHIRDMARKAALLEMPKAVADRFSRYRDDPVGFVESVLGGASATRRSDGTPYQFEILQDLIDFPRVAVQSGHGVGKTRVDAWAMIWWLITRPLSRVLVLAPEFTRQIRAIVFGEARKVVTRSKEPLPLKVLGSRIMVEGAGEEWSATGMSASGDPGLIEGFHAEGGLLLVMDESKGIPQAAFDALQGALTGAEDSRLLVTSVPGGAGAGPFWKACQDKSRWRVHHIPSTDSSRVGPTWVEDRKHDWGEGSPLYQTRVLGEFADSGDGVLFPLTLLDAATERELDSAASSAEVGVGVDVARSIAGDWNALGVVRGGRIESPRLFRETDTMVTVHRVLALLATTGADRVAVDVGGVGAGVVDRLRQLEGRRKVDAVSFGGGANDPARFLNRRAELFWLLREAMERGGVSLPDDDELRADLSALRYVFTAKGQIQIESKDEVRTRLGRSCDRADAVALAWSAVAPVRRRMRPQILVSGGAKPGERVTIGARPTVYSVSGIRAPRIS